MANRIVLNPVSYHGVGAVKEIGGELQRRERKERGEERRERTGEKPSER